MNCGIYKIINIVNSKVYVGSSIDIEVRWKKHLFTLRNNKHCNPYLQRSWNKYGDVFIFEILLYCDEENLIFYEQRAMDEYKSLDGKFGYNSMPARRTNLVGSNYDKWIEKKSKTNKGKNHPMAKSVIINGKHYNTITEASKNLEINITTLRKRLKNGIDINKPLAKEGKNHPKAKVVEIKGRYYDTIKEASQDLGIKYSTLKSRLKNRIDLNKTISRKGKNHFRSKTVMANFKYYSTITEATLDLKIHRNTIVHRIKTNKLGYSWV